MLDFVPAADLAAVPPIDPIRFFAPTAPVKLDLSHSQRLLWMGQRLSPESPLYNMVLAFQLKGPLDVAAFQRAWAKLLGSTDALRMTLREVDGAPHLECAPATATDLAVHEVPADSDSTPAQADDWARRWCAERAGRPLNMSAQLVDAALLQLGDGRYIFYCNQHHLITDAWSITLCFDRLAALYAADASVPAQPPQFAQALQRHHERLGSPAHRRALAHWEERGALEPTPVAFYGNSPEQRSSRTERVPCQLGRERSKRLSAFAEQPEARGLTPQLSRFHVFATALFALMHRVGSGAEHLTLLAPMHCRASRADKQTAGLFMEVFPLRVDLGPSESFASLLAKVRADYRELLLHAQPGTSNAASTRSVDVLLNYIPSSFGTFDGRPVQSEWVHSGHGDPAHALRLQVHDFDGAGEFTLHFDCNCDVFGATERNALREHFVHILDALLADPDCRIADVDLVDSAERERQLVQWNATARSWPWPNVLDRIADQLERNPDAIAVRHGAIEWTYRDLDHRASSIHGALRAQGIQPGSTIALLLQRSPDTVAAILGSLRAGCTFVPLDPSYPSPRVAFQLDDSQAELVLARTDQDTTLPGDWAGRTVWLDRDLPTATSAPADQAPAPTIDPEDLAYVIYTSGSTGRPKGVEIRHRSLANYVFWAASHYAGDQPTDLPLFSPVAVDLTITSLFLPLVTGGAVVVYDSDPGHHDLAVLRVFAEDAVDIVKLTPAHLALLLEHGSLTTQRVRSLIVGGEDLPRRLAQRVHDALGEGVSVFNEYGPTEATVGCMIHRHDAEHETAASVPIGGPIANARIYVLDDAMRPLPRGVHGELWIGGGGVARGYRGAAEATAERFLDSPFVTGDVLYRTGDLARIDPATGHVLFLGRSDDQVKIRGARVELAEVRACVEAYDGVRDAAITLAARAQSTTGAAESSTDLAADPRWHNVTHCVRCGLASNHPDAKLDHDQVCAVCHEYDSYKDAAEAYFRTPDDLRALFRDQLTHPTGKYDCVMLLSGGKDSTYALYQLVELGLRPLVFSLDNGYISDSAKANIQRVVDHLGLDLEFASTPSMNAIFADSLARFSNVCQGCFKAIYTLSTQLAERHGIRHIVTGLSRGQIFETRLADFFRNGVRDPDEVDRMIVEARKAYHRVDDVVSRQLDVSLFAADEIFGRVQFVDFYRYWHVPLEEVLRFIRTRAAWTRPEDTGRSTNCLINDTGISVHKRVRGYHNYALPYSWDVRLGHKTRDECLAELDDAIDEERVQRTLFEVGSDLAHGAAEAGATDQRLVAYFTSPEDSISITALRQHVADHLPAFMVPSAFVQLPELPLTAAGKVDVDALPAPEVAADHKTRRERDTTPPSTDTQRQLCTVWADVLGLESLGIHEHFLELGGDSILSIQVVARARTAGLRLSPDQVFAHPTIAELAQVATALDAAPATASSVDGALQLTPIQRQFLDQQPIAPHHCGQSYVLGAAEPDQPLDRDALRTALQQVVDRHDALRLTFRPRRGEFEQTVAPSTRVELECLEISRNHPDHDGPDHGSRHRSAALQKVEQQLNEAMALDSGCLLRAAVVRFEAATGADEVLILVIHHLGVDAVAWTTILRDLNQAYSAFLLDRDRSSPPLPSPPPTPWSRWTQTLASLAQRLSPAERARSLPAADWADVVRLPIRATERAPLRRTERTATATWSTEQTNRVVEQLREAATTRPTAPRLHEVVHAGFAQAVHDQTAGSGSTPPSLLFDVEGHGRDLSDFGDAPQLDFSDSVGWFATLYPVAVPLAADPIDTLDGLRTALRAAPGGGHGFGLLQYDPATRTRAGQAEILFNFLGETGAILREGPLRVRRGLGLSRSPDAARPYLLEVHGTVTGGALSLSAVYSPEQLSGSFVEGLLAAALRIALALVDGGIGPSTADFPNAELSSTELDDILSDFGDDA